MENIARIKGFDINLDEITSALKQMACIKKATTIVYNITGINYICSYITVKSPVSKESIREFLNSILPYYMIPAYIIFLNDLPLSSDGKVLKNLLPPPVNFDIIKNKEDFVLPEEKFDMEIFKKYDNLLSKNVSSNIKKLEKTPIGDIFMTGVTTPLGIAILGYFLKKEKGIIYCLLRDKNEISAEQRLINSLHSVFGNMFDIDIGSRIRIVRGRPSEYEFGLTEEEYDALGLQVNTVIHCAELSKKNESLENYRIANVKGTQKIVDLCEKFNLRLIYISTTDIFEKHININDSEISEQNYFIGQKLDNPYIKSKFEAEQIVLASIYNGLSAYIIRISPSIRNSFNTNSAISIVTLANHYSSDFCIFHILDKNDESNNISSKFTNEFLSLK